MHALEFFCTCCTCANTAIYHTRATLALKMAARACSAAAGALGRAVRACFGAASALEMAALARPGAASALKKAAQACFDAARALKIAILACSGATRALKKPARARFSATECAQRGCSSLLFEITIRKCWSRLHPALSHCTLLHFAPCMDMHGYTLVHNTFTY